MTRFHPLLILACLALGCAKSPGEGEGRGGPPKPDAKQGSQAPKGAEPDRAAPQLWFDRFMIDLPNGAKCLIDPFGEKLKKWGKLKPDPFRKAVTQRILKALEPGKILGLSEIEDLTVVVDSAGPEGEAPVEFRIGDFASVEEIECSETK
ncbi:MAG: hypothetical protein ACYS47_05340 [Planctomycetota bacterium]|jgi:hypothetical protein